MGVVNLGVWVALGRFCFPEASWAAFGTVAGEFQNQTRPHSNPKIERKMAKKYIPQSKKTALSLKMMLLKKFNEILCSKNGTKLVLLSHQLINAHGTRALISCRRGRSCPNKKASLLALELLLGRSEAMRAAGFESRFAEVLPVGVQLL